MININFDSSVKEVDKKRGIRVIVRNDKREVLEALQASIEGITDPNTIKAHAANKASMFAQFMGFTRIILDGDAFMFINKILHPYPSLSRIGNLVEDAKNLMKNCRKCKVQHVKKEANEAAHLLAKCALTVDEDLYWVEDCPDILIPVIIKDCNFLSS